MMKENKTPENILIIRLSSLGDVLLTTPVVRSLKKKFPSAEIDFLVKPQYKEALKHNPYLRNIFEYVPKNLKEIIKTLRNNKYDFVLDLQNNLRSRKVRKALKTKTYVFHKPTFEKFMLVHFKKNYFGGVFPIPYRYALAVKDLQLDNEGLDLFLPKDLAPVIKKEENYIGFCPGARHFTKRYPAEYFVRLGKLLGKEGFQIAIFGGKDDTEICSEIASKIPNAKNLCNENKLFETAVNIKECKAVICNDSGLMHTAAAVKTPVVAIFGSTVKEFGFVPFGVKNIILERNDVPCRPCSHIGREKCPKKHFDCMRKLTPEEVFAETINFLKTI